MTQTLKINDMFLFYPAGEEQAAGWVRQACEKCARLIPELWGLETPKDCRVYVMTSWLGFVFRSAPWHWKILLALTLPLWAVRARRVWQVAGGWELSYGKQRAVGVKPPRLLQAVDKSIGERFFIREEDPGRKLQSITCHELTHAYCAHLHLPTWLKEGLAMATVDRYFGKATVQSETLERLQPRSKEASFAGQQRLQVGDEEALVDFYTRAYWLTHFIEETRPGLLKELFSQGTQREQYEHKIAAAIGKTPVEFWNSIDAELVAHFKEKR